MTPFAKNLRALQQRLRAKGIIVTVKTLRNTYAAMLRDGKRGKR